MRLYKKNLSKKYSVHIQNAPAKTRCGRQITEEWVEVFSLHSVYEVCGHCSWLLPRQRIKCRLCPREFTLNPILIDIPGIHHHCSNCEYQLKKAAQSAHHSRAIKSFTAKSFRNLAKI